MNITGKKKYMKKTRQNLIISLSLKKSGVILLLIVVGRLLEQTGKTDTPEQTVCVI